MVKNVERFLCLLSDRIVWLALLVLSCCHVESINWNAQVQVQVPEQMPIDSNGDAISDGAPGLGYYAAFAAPLLGGEETDPHAVHGIETAGGGFAVVGKYNRGTDTGGFIVVSNTAEDLSGSAFLESTGANLWKATFGTVDVPSETTPGNGANMVAQVGEHLFVAGFLAESQAIVNAALFKYEASTGALVWSTTFPADATGGTSAFEAVHATADGGLILTGLECSDVNCLEGFKSYGNPAYGTAMATYLGPEEVSSSTAPVVATWKKLYSGYITGKGVSEIPSSGGYVIATSTSEGTGAVLKINTEGALQWYQSIPDHGEVTEVSVAADGTYLFVSGHGAPGITGKLTRMAVSDGSVAWTKAYGGASLAGGVNQYANVGSLFCPTDPWFYSVYEECWSVAATDDGGAVVACGTGIEGCLFFQLKCILFDPRKAWRSFLFKVDANGTVLWYRVENYQNPDNEPTVASASEFVVTTSDGGYLATNDEEFGVGILRLQPA